jgi:hypothetical protein
VIFSSALFWQKNIEEEKKKQFQTFATQERRDDSSFVKCTRGVRSRSSDPSLFAGRIRFSKEKKGEKGYSVLFLFCVCRRSSMLITNL